jgi:Lon protease-like protein
MPGRLLPIFPLGITLLPHERLPLHIFEDRYKEMIRECLELGVEFGVVLQKGEGILRTGCTASVEQIVKKYEDGRLDILTAGRRRFEILELNTERSYLRADVSPVLDEDFEDPEPETVNRAMAAYESLAGAESGPPRNAPELSFRLAAVSEDQDFRQVLLSTLSEAERMEKVAEHLAWLVFRRRTQRAMKRVARSNGHGKHMAGFGEGL